MLGAVLVSPDSLTPMVVKIAEQYNVEPALIKGIVENDRTKSFVFSRQLPIPVVVSVSVTLPAVKSAALGL